MRQLTEDQKAFVRSLEPPKLSAAREEQRKNQEAHEAAMAAARAESDRLYAIRTAEYEERKRQEALALQPLKDALRAAGIKLEFDGYYDGAWMRFQIGDGPVVDLEQGLSAFDGEEDE